MMQCVIGVACVAVGVLWLRALTRVRDSILDRRAAMRRLREVMQWDADAAAVMVHGVVRLQSRVRGWRVRVWLDREVAMDAYDGASTERGAALWLVHGVVIVYLAFCGYTAVLYGTCVGDGGRWQSDDDR